MVPARGPGAYKNINKRRVFPFSALQTFELIGVNVKRAANLGKHWLKQTWALKTHLLVFVGFHVLTSKQNRPLCASIATVYKTAHCSEQSAFYGHDRTMQWSLHVGVFKPSVICKIISNHSKQKHIKHFLMARGDQTLANATRSDLMKLLKNTKCA